MFFLSSRNPAHHQRIGPSASFIMLKSRCARRACGIVSTSLRWRFHRWNWVDTRKALTSKPGSTGRIIRMLPDFEFCHRRSSLSACIREVSIQQAVWGRHCTSVTVSGRLYAVKKRKNSLSRASCVVLFYHFLELKIPSNPRGSSVCKELLLFLPVKHLLAGYLLLVHPALKSLTGAVDGQGRSFCSLAPLIGPCYVRLPSGRPSKRPVVLQTAGLAPEWAADRAGER